MPDEVLTTLDQQLLNALDEIRVDGQGPTEAQKQFALQIVKMAPDYALIRKAVEKGTDEELQKAKQIVQEQTVTSLRAPLLKAVKGLPHPKGGRPRLLSEADKRRARKRIAYLLENSDDSKFKDVIKRVADAFG